MNGSVSYEGAILSGNISINASANLEELTADHNGIYLPSQGKDGFSKVTVDVPDAVLDDITITENGHYTPPIGVDGYNDIVVSVPHPAPILDEITITENGSYQPPTGVDGYDDITVNVLPDLDDITITANGHYTPPTGTDGYDDITVNVPLPANGIYKQTLSGLPSPIATFTGADAPLDSLKASIVGVQSGSGEPSPQNVRPISGWTSCVVNRTGKNLIDDSEVLRGYFNQLGNFVDSTKSLSYEAEFKAGTYTFSTDLDNCVITRYFINDDVYEPVSETQTLTINSNVNFDFRISIRNASSTVISTTPQTMIERGDQATTYEAYSGNTYTIQFKDSSDNPINAYRGTIDITTGVATFTHKLVTYNGSESWRKSSTYEGSFYLPASAVPDRKPDTAFSCNMAKYVDSNYAYGTCLGTSGQSAMNFWIAEPNTTLEAFQSWLSTHNLQVEYELSTPITMQFDPLALRSNGVTNISVDCGEVTELKYFSETP